MKTTYLVNKEQADGSVYLTAVSSAEWLEVVESNKSLPADCRRYFILDYIAEDGDLDRMVIEAPADVYRDWHRGHMAERRHREHGKGLRRLSLDAPIPGKSDPIRLGESLASEEDLEEAVCSRMLMDELRKKLAAWKPWANELLDLYLLGQRRTCTAALAEKYGVSQQVIRKYKRQFEEYVKNFLLGVSL